MALKLFEYHPVIGYRFVPGVATEVEHGSGSYFVRCNQAGFRCDHEVTARPKDGTFRAIVFGDSHTVGEGVSNGKRFSDLLEAQMPASEVLNFGLPGSGTDQQFLAFREYAAGIEYHLLLICPMVSNIWRILKSEQVTMGAVDGRLVHRPKPYFRLDDSNLRLENQPVPQELRHVDPDELDDEVELGLLRRLVRNLVRCWPELHCLSQRVRSIRSPAEYDDPDGNAWRLMKAILVAWIRLSRAPVILYPIPTLVHINRCVSAQGYSRRFAELSTEERVELVDVLPEFWNLPAARRKRCSHPTDDHPTELGHEILAKVVSPHVRRHYDQFISRREALF